MHAIYTSQRSPLGGSPHCDLPRHHPRRRGYVLIYHRYIHAVLLTLHINEESML